MKLLLVVNFALALYLIGLIWTVQVVHYPSFGLVGAAEWAAFHRAHTTRMTWVVMAPMVAELLLGGWLAARGGAVAGGWLGWAAFALVLVAWAHTGLVAVPLHNRLAAGPDAVLVAALVRTNWVRTVAWTLRAAILGWLLIAITKQ